MARKAAADPELEAGIAAALELFAPLGAVRARKMFGGAGIYCDGLMFALVAGSEIFLKADTVSLPRYEVEGCTPFEWTAGDGKVMTMSYRRMPDSAFDDAGEAHEWATFALESARRAAR